MDWNKGFSASQKSYGAGFTETEGTGSKDRSKASVEQGMRQEENGLPSFNLSGLFW